MIKALLVLLVALPAWAQVPVPPYSAPVVDQTKTLTREQQAALSRMLEEFEARKGSQIAVLLVPTTQPEEIEQYSIRVGEQWKTGRKNVDDGAIMVVAKDDRAVRIEVGYGLEGPLNDATANRIIREAVLPRFREGDFYGGITAGVDRMMRVIDGEPLPAPEAPQPQVGGGIGQSLPILLMAALFVGGVLRVFLGRALGSMAAGGVVGALTWLLVGTLGIALIAGLFAFFVTLVGGGGRRGYYGGIPGGFHRGGSFGGGFGGGFRGGGGGTFGGGGATGRW